MSETMRYRKLQMVVRLLTCLLLLAAVALQRNGDLFGHSIEETPELTTSSDTPVITFVDNGIIINTSTLASDVKGYGGPVPLEIKIVDNKITAITPLRNAETPGFFERVQQELIPQWIDVPIDETASRQIDAVSGATFSSKAVIANIKAGAQYALANTEARNTNTTEFENFSAKELAAIIAVVLAMTLPLFIHNKIYRYVQLAINVVVLGFWCSTFLSYSLLVSYISNGVNWLYALPWLLMLIVAFVYPYFGKKNYYCTWICPLGSLQELAGSSIKYKLRIPPRFLRGLNIFHDWLWVVLMLVMCAGIYAEWMDYELFSAFLFQHAYLGVLIAAGVFILLSFVVMRPYCRFVCPTGSLFRVSECDPSFLNHK